MWKITPCAYISGISYKISSLNKLFKIRIMRGEISNEGKACKMQQNLHKCKDSTWNTFYAEYHIEIEEIGEDGALSTS